MWKESFVAILVLGFIFSGSLAQEYAVDQDPNVYVDVKNKNGPPPDGVQASSASLIFNNENVVVNPGDRLHLDCGVQGTFRSCIWEKGGDHQQTFQVEDVHEGFFNGMSKPENIKGNECGIVINSVSAKDHGEWTCKVFVVANTLKGSKNIVVTVRPQKPTLDINESPLVISENQESKIGCTVSAARPAARVRWYVGTEDVTQRSNSENIPTDDKGTYRTVSTLKYKFPHSDDRKSLTCSIQHPTLMEPEYAEVALDIRYAPYPLSSNQIYGIPMENEYEIKYNFTSNPVPEMRWYIGNQEIPVPGESGRYLANIRNLMDNIYMATLKIRDFTNNDVGLKYRLSAKNDLGERNFDITLSTGPAPPDGDIELDTDEIIATPDQYSSEVSIGSGTLAAIIVVVILILILLFIIGMMRYRQMYCFGNKDRITNHLKESGENLREEHSDTESTREPNPSSNKTNIFKNFKLLVKSKRGPKETNPENVEEGDPKEEEGEARSKNNPEVVYAELELGNGEKEKKNGKPAANESTEYAEIVGTIPDNKNQERKE